MQIMKLPALGEDVWREHLPAFAPLSEAFVSHLYQYPGALALPRSQETLADQIWKQSQQARRITSYFLIPAVDTMQEKVEIDWFRRNWQSFDAVYKDKLLPRTTHEEWTRKRLLRAPAHGFLEPNSVAALCMMRYLFLREQRFWLPRRQKTNAPWFYVWGLRPDDLIPRAYPYPLPDNLPANTLLWSQWIGASWQRGWLRVPGIGALAWGKTVMLGKCWYWDLTEDELSAWDRSLVRDASVARRFDLLAPIYRNQPSQSYSDGEQRYHRTRLHTLATLILQHIGEPLLAGYINHYYSTGKPPSRTYKPF